MSKPMPDQRGYWGQYWQGVQERRLKFQRCSDCGHQFFYARICCPQCASQALEWFESAGTGTVYSYTVVRRHTNPGFAAELPYAIALVDMDDLSPGVRMTARVQGCQPSDVQIGMRVQTDFTAYEGDLLLPVFKPHS